MQDAIPAAIADAAWWAAVVPLVAQLPAGELSADALLRSPEAARVALLGLDAAATT